MKNFVLPALSVLVISWSPASAAEPAEQGARPFDFMGYTAGEPAAPEQLKRCGKGPNVTCMVNLVKLSTVYVGYAIKFRDYQLSTVYVDAHPNSYGPILDAFTAKYGTPCKTEGGVWKNAAGAALDNPVTYWCFKSGKLSVARYGSRIDKMLVWYEDDNREPPAKPVMNF